MKILCVLVVITDRQTDKQTDRQTDRQTDGRTDRWTDRDINPVWASLTTFLQVKPVQIETRLLEYGGNKKAVWTDGLLAKHQK